MYFEVGDGSRFGNSRQAGVGVGIKYFLTNIWIDRFSWMEIFKAEIWVGGVRNSKFRTGVGGKI